MKKIHYRTIDGNSIGFGSLIAFLGLLIAVGLGAAVYMEHNGHWVTGMNNQIVWGTPHVFAVFLIVPSVPFLQKYPTNPWLACPDCWRLPCWLAGWQSWYLTWVAPIA